MKIPRIMIAATGSGTGKTTITCAVLSALKARGISPCSFKCGPDYIDPMFHRTVLGVDSGNLDTFFTDDEMTKSLFLTECSGDMAIIEGVMGLYDGVGGIEVAGSSYDLAKALMTPIILVVNARGMGKSILAEIKGFLDFDEFHLIKGVILNRVSKSFGNTLKALIEKELQIKVIGTLENNTDISIDSRHLGLVMPNEIEHIKEKLEIARNMVEDSLDFDELIRIGNSAEPLSEKKLNSLTTDGEHIKLAVARDEAFCFYYKENINMLKNYGVDIEYFSPIHDKKLPKEINGLLLGGGYPEYYLKELEGNTSMRQDILEAMENNLPVLAECGGFMYLMDSILDRNGISYKMVGALNGTSEWKGKLVRFGYVTIEKDNEMVKGHEFHYFDSDNNGEAMVLTKPSTGKSTKGMHFINDSYIGYPHLYYPSSKTFVKKYVEAMRHYGIQKISI